MTGTDTQVRCTSAALAMRRETARGRRFDTITSVYGTLLIGAMTVAMVLTAVVRVDETRRGVLLGASGWLPWALAVACTCGLTAACCAVGPARTDRATTYWLLGTRVDRGALLRPAVLGSACVAGLAGAVGGLLVALTAHPGPPSGTAVLGGLLGSLIGVACHQAVLLVQGFTGRTAALGWWAKAMSLGSGLVAVIGLRLHSTVVVPGATTVVGVAAVLAATIVIGSGAVLMPVLRRVRGDDLRRGGSLVASVTDSVQMLDASAWSSRADGRRLRRHGSFPSVPAARGVWAEVLRRDLVGAWRAFPDVLSRLVLVVPVWAAGLLLGPWAAATGAVLTAYGVALVVADRLQLWLGSSSLWRLLPQDPRAVTAMWCVVPTASAMVTVSLISPMVSLPWAAALAIGPAATAAVVRRCFLPPMELGMMVDSPLGALPLGILRNVATGFDVLVVVTVLGMTAGWPVTALLAVVVLVALVCTRHPGE